MSYENTIAIQTWNLTKKYRQYEKEIDRLIEIFLRRRNNKRKEFTAVNGVNLSLRKGETLGIIGRNGSGKSTLLQMICGTVTQTSGNIEVQGRIGALLELGTGFNQEFSGLDNIELNATLLGLNRKEIKERMASIIKFADIGDFIYRPVKEYSSGMVVRLAFAVQAHIDPSILIIDEALAVGDELFQKKCFERLKWLKDNGCSIILVSHSTRQVNEHCDRVILMSKGNVLLEGLPHDVTTIYQSLLPLAESEWVKQIENLNCGEGIGKNRAEIEKTNKKLSNEKKDITWEEELKSKSTYWYNSNGAKIKDICLYSMQGKKGNEVAYKEPFYLEVAIESDKNFDEVRVACFISAANGRRVTGAALPEKTYEGKEMKQGQKYIYRFEFDGRLWPGIYFVGAGISEIKSKGEFIHRVVDLFAMRIRETERELLQIGETSLGIHAERKIAQTGESKK